MKNHRLIDAETKGLVAIMEELSNVNHHIAIVYHKMYGEDCEIESNSDYTDVQAHILDAIERIGSMLGKNIAGKFY